MDIIIPQKRCPRCENFFPATTQYFSPRKRKGKKTGLHSKCKTCTALYAKELRQRPDDYIHSEEFKEKKRQYDQEYRIGYAEKHKVVSINYNQRHKDERREYNREYDKLHVEERRLHGRVASHRRRIRNQAARGSYTRHDIQAQYERQKKRCYYCSVKLTEAYQIEHVIPLSRGGSNDMSNIVLACPTCNRSKFNKLPHEWPEGGRLL